MGRRLDRRDGVVDPDALEELARMTAYHLEALAKLYTDSVKVMKRVAQVMNRDRRTSRRRI